MTLTVLDTDADIILALDRIIAAGGYMSNSEGRVGPQLRSR
jgi:hypothetical protein